MLNGMTLEMRIFSSNPSSVPDLTVLRTPAHPLLLLPLRPAVPEYMTRQRTVHLVFDSTQLRHISLVGHPLLPSSKNELPCKVKTPIPSSSRRTINKLHPRHFVYGIPPQTRMPIPVFFDPIITLNSRPGASIP